MLDQNSLSGIINLDGGNEMESTKDLQSMAADLDAISLDEFEAWWQHLDIENQDLDHPEPGDLDGFQIPPERENRRGYRF